MAAERNHANLDKDINTGEKKIREIGNWLGGLPLTCLFIRGNNEPWLVLSEGPESSF